MNGYNLENPEELYEFSQACEEACCTCPQYSPWNPIDFDEGRNEISPFEVFMYWKEGPGGDILFQHGYCAELDEETMDTFNRYVNNVDSNIIDLSTGKFLSKKPILILTFCIEGIQP